MFTAIKAFFSGVTGYAYLAVGALVLALSGAVAYLWLWHKEDVAKLETKDQVIANKDKDIAAEKALTAQFRIDLGEAQAEAAFLAQRTRVLDSIIKDRDERLKDKDAEKKAIENAFEKLAAAAPKASQDCFASPLPPAVVEWLRSDGPVAPSPRKDENSSGKGP